MSQADIGLIGLAVMGENLVLNMASKGFTVAVFNRTVSKVHDFIEGRAQGKSIIGCDSVAELCKSLKRPRRVMLMVKAGAVVDQFIDQIIPHLEPGDVIIDGGNSHYPDSERRVKQLEEKGLLYIGTGVSGGEEGALLGPSIMPGGSPAAWPHVRDIFQRIAAQVDGEPCCQWVGRGGAGHFVKMVHNGIEYGDMQLICEVYHLMKSVGGLTNDEIGETFARWNKGKLDSYLIEITADIFDKRDEETGKHVVDLILDAAGQKGTGKWTGTVALDLGIPVTLIVEAVFARSLSSRKEERVEASKSISGPEPVKVDDRRAFLDALENALYCAKIVSYAQGFALMREASSEFSWELNYGNIAMMWRGGCIIRSRFLGDIKRAFEHEPGLTNLLLDPFFAEAVASSQHSWREVISIAVRSGIPTPALSAALSYFDGYRTATLPANLLQAQRDYFGAHTYERIDRPRGEVFHTNWTGRGGTTASTSYNL